MAKIEITEPDDFTTEAGNRMRNLCKQLEGYRERTDQMMAEAREHIAAAEKLIADAFAALR